MFSSVSSQLSSVLFLEIRYCIYIRLYSHRGKTRLDFWKTVDRMSWRLLTGQPNRPAYYSFHGRKNPAPPPPPRAYLKPYQLHGQEVEPRHLSIYVSSVDPDMWSCWVCISWGKKLLDLKKVSTAVTARTYYVLYTQGKCLCILYSSLIVACAI